MSDEKKRRPPGPVYGGPGFIIRPKTFVVRVEVKANGTWYRVSEVDQRIELVTVAECHEMATNVELQFLVGPEIVWSRNVHELCERTVEMRRGLERIGKLFMTAQPGDLAAEDARKDWLSFMKGIVWEEPRLIRRKAPYGFQVVGGTGHTIIDVWGTEAVPLLAERP